LGGAINVRLENPIFGKTILQILPRCDPAHPVYFFRYRTGWAGSQRGRICRMVCGS